MLLPPEETAQRRCERHVVVEMASADLVRVLSLSFNRRFCSDTCWLVFARS